MCVCFLFEFSAQPMHNAHAHPHPRLIDAKQQKREKEWKKAAHSTLIIEHRNAFNRYFSMRLLLLLLMVQNQDFR